MNAKIVCMGEFWNQPRDGNEEWQRGFNGVTHRVVKRQQWVESIEKCAACIENLAETGTKATRVTSPEASQRSLLRIVVKKLIWICGQCLSVAFYAPSVGSFAILSFSMKLT